MISIYTLTELINLSLLPEWKVKLKILSKTAEENLRWRYNLQVALSQFSKSNALNHEMQMKIVQLTIIIERYVRNALMKCYLEEVRTKHSNETNARYKELAKALVENYIKRRSY